MRYEMHSESARDISRHIAQIRFFYDGNWWQFDLDAELNDDNLRRSRKYKGSAKDRLKFWQLDKNKRHILEGCEDPKKSNLLPDMQYAKIASSTEYTDHVHREMEFIMFLRSEKPSSNES